MRRLLFAGFLFISSFLQAGIYERNYGYILAFNDLSYDDFELHLSCPEWQPRAYYYGITPSSVGYFYVDTANMTVYGSNRYVLNDDLDAFYQSLEPLAANLLPYATPNASSCSASRIISKQATTIAKIAAIKVVLELTMPGSEDEMVTSYIFTKHKIGLFSESNVGYTYSISCVKSRYSPQLVDNIASKLVIR